MSDQAQPEPVIIGMSGASGVIHGVELLRALKDLGIAAHLILSHAAARNLQYETELSPPDVTALAAKVYDPQDLAAPPASGSFLHRGMIVAPCSMKTLSAIAHSYADNLLVRSADVCLKEKRPLILMPRETPLHQGHLENMLKAARMGATILPPMPAFYHQPASVRDIVMQSVGKALDQLGIRHKLFKRWGS